MTDEPILLTPAPPTLVGCDGNVLTYCDGSRWAVPARMGVDVSAGESDGRPAVKVRSIDYGRLGSKRGLLIPVGANAEAVAAAVVAVANGRPPSRLVPECDRYPWVGEDR